MFYGIRAAVRFDEVAAGSPDGEREQGTAQHRRARTDRGGCGVAEGGGEGLRVGGDIHQPGSQAGSERRARRADRDQERRRRWRRSFPA
ncbi:hypothetical protein [Nocardia sp. NPDC005366]|uniref:hypothetical protein n=1 Tax=Nocardia sp. NPDC005366 TaxID=3156878 RepID=UPI0033B1D918